MFANTQNLRDNIIMDESEQQLTLEEMIAELMIIKRCILCSQNFSEMQSMGAQECRRHPGRFQGTFTDYGGTLGAYACCNTSPHMSHNLYGGFDAALGCVQCDHVSNAGDLKNIDMPVERAQIVFGKERLSDRHVYYDERSHTITIVREQAQKYTRHLH